MGITGYDVFVTGFICLFYHSVSAGFNCTFDTDACGWTQDQRDNFDWTRHLGDTKSAGTGPSYDHTSGHGYYMYIEVQRWPTPGEKARLISPAINITNQMCLVFYYHMYGLHINTLSVYLSQNGSIGRPVWTKLRSQGDVWERATVQITGESTNTPVTNVVVEATQGDFVVGDIAIDDISLQAGTCPQEPYRTIRLISPLNNGVGRIEVYHSGSWGTVCDNGFTDKVAEVACRQLEMIKTWSKPTTISVGGGTGRIWLDNIRCHGNEMSLAECQHSPWGSHSCTHSEDVGVNCDSEGLNCTFDTNTCGWAQIWKNNFNWTRSFSGEPGGESRPNSDHTSGYGSYMYMETTDSLTQDRVGSLKSVPFNGTAGACLVFYYQMFGLNGSGLQVYLKSTASPQMVLWTSVETRGNVWKKVMVQINERPTTMQIRFTGVLGAGTQGSVAIDDVSLRLGTCHQEQRGPGDVTEYNNTAAIIGGVVAVVAIAVFVAVIVYLYRRHTSQPSFRGGSNQEDFLRINTHNTPGEFRIV